MPHQWRERELYEWARARVTMACVLEMQCKAKYLEQLGLKSDDTNDPRPLLNYVHMTTIILSLFETLIILWSVVGVVCLGTA